MAYCKKCGAYIPIDETACPACGYDPEEEERKAREAAEEEKRKQAEAARREEEERRRKQEAENWAARERAREEERRRAAQSGNNRRTYGSSQTQYTSQRTGQSGAAQGQYASQRREETWVPPWSQTEEQDRTEEAKKTMKGGPEDHHWDRMTEIWCISEVRMREWKPLIRLSMGSPIIIFR